MPSNFYGIFSILGHSCRAEMQGDKVMKGFTQDEIFLSTLGRASFLRLWSWPNLFRDQGKKADAGDGKEICDLAVFFGTDAILFSDKRIAFNSCIDTKVAWSRWARRAIRNSIQQLEGGCRWIRQFPERIFLDPNCCKRLPIVVAPPDELKFHFVVVCHGIEEALIKNHGDPSFVFDTSITGEDHWADKNCEPFVIGRLPASCFVHVFNEATVHLVLTEFDTAKDFLNYLREREKLLSLERQVLVRSEADLIHLYYQGIDDRNHLHSISIEKIVNYDRIFIDMGGIAALRQDPSYQAKKAEDQISYFWDQLIDHFSHHMLEGTSLHKNWTNPSEVEPAFREMANMGRFERRYLSQAFIEFYERTPPGHRATRLAYDVFDDEKVYLFFLLVHTHHFSSIEQYRDTRFQMLRDYLMIYKLRNPSVRRIVGIAAQTRRDGKDKITPSFFSEGQDFGLLTVANWDSSREADARRLEQEYLTRRLIAEQQRTERKLREFPEVQLPKPTGPGRVPTRSSGRNKPCGCGSGRKFKNCCGSLH